MPLPELGRFFEDHLRHFVMPFWMKHAVDEKGGINTCITDEGTITSYDKLMWSQLRAVYTFSALYNRIEPRQEWLDIATQIFQFCAKYGRDDQGQWLFRVTRDGEPIEGATSIFSDGFALKGFSEYFRATGDENAKRLAMETYHNVQQRLAKPGSYKTDPEPIPPGMKAHAISMIFSAAFFELSEATGNQDVAQAALYQANQVMDVFRRPEKKAILELVELDDTLQDSPAGRSVVPGHALESMWFQIHQFRKRGMMDRVAQCVECIRWHIEKGWDPEYGGILLTIDVEGKTPVYGTFHDAKVWWPVTEAMYALLLAHTICGEPWCLDWYWKVHEVAFKYYPVPEHGEWTQRLDRHFNKITDVVALPVKDPFHLPRALILCVELLKNL